MISKWLFSAALLLEGGSWATLWLAAPELQQLLMFSVSHALACAMLCGAVWLLLPARYRAPLPWSPLFIFSLAFFIPVIGMLGVVLSIFPALYLPRKRDTQAWQATGMERIPSATAHFDRVQAVEIGVPDAYLQEPWKWPGAKAVLGRLYPEPIVDVTAAARAARDACWGLRKERGYREEIVEVIERHASRSDARFVNDRSPRPRRRGFRGQRGG